MKAFGAAVELVGMGSKNGVGAGTLPTIGEEALGDGGEDGRRGRLLGRILGRRVLVVVGHGGWLKGNGRRKGEVAGRAVRVGGGAGGGDGLESVDGVHG